MMHIFHMILFLSGIALGSLTTYSVMKTKKGDSGLYSEDDESHAP